MPSVVVKQIDVVDPSDPIPHRHPGRQPPLHPRGWNTDRSDLRKRRSYEVERSWYQTVDPSRLRQLGCRVPTCLESIGYPGGFGLVLEDLDASGYSVRVSRPSLKDLKRCLHWLANFHAHHLISTQSEPKFPADLWERGTYWHLATRPDEWVAMPNAHPLRINADRIDRCLRIPVQTIVHGDAKLANFCFDSNSPQVAAVDFQYVGPGCGMSDVAYLLGSALNDEMIAEHECELLDHYFTLIEASIERNNCFNLANPGELSATWRPLYPVAWTDFTRFLIGWSPTHQKLTPYASALQQRCLKYLDA